MRRKNKLLCASLLLSGGVLSNHALAQSDNENYIANEKSSNQFVEQGKALHPNYPNDKAIRTPSNTSVEDFKKLRNKHFSNERHYLAKNKQSIKSLNTNAVGSGCSATADLYTLTGQPLIDMVKASSLSDCLYGLYGEPTGSPAFADDKIETIAQELSTFLDSYDATNVQSANELENLVTYLRALHYVEYSSGKVFTASYLDKLHIAFTKYFSLPSFAVFSGEATRDFMVKREMLILVSSSKSNQLPYLESFTQALVGYANTVSQSNDWGVYWEEKAVDELLTHLYYAITDRETELEQLLITSPNIINNLKQFVDVDGKWMVAHTREGHWTDAINELGRYLRFTGPLADSVRPSIQGILNDYSHTGDGSKGWLNAQSAVVYNDNANCDLYGDVCEFDLESAILSGHHICSDSVTLRYQEPIAADDLAGICQDLASQEQLFHSTFNTTKATPVADDYNQFLEVVIFSSYNDYDTYASDFFGIDTDNGGYYVEGSPYKTGNQARFFAHQATWTSETFVWNLEHEFIHYLDGRFNKWGRFYEQPVNSVWWGEGIAEYLSQPNNNPNALNAAQEKTYSLSEVFQTTYANSDTARTYYWGYLATRFMMEEKHSFVENELLPTLRAAKYDMTPGDCTIDWSWHRKIDAITNEWDWAYDDSEKSSGDWVWTCGRPDTPTDSELPEFTPYADVINNWGTSFDQEFSDWLTCIVEGEGECVTTRLGDLDGNNAIDVRDIKLFTAMLRKREPISLDYDFNNDGAVNFRDVRPMMALCDLAQCAIAPR